MPMPPSAEMVKSDPKALPRYFATHTSARMLCMQGMTIASPKPFTAHQAAACSMPKFQAFGLSMVGRCYRQVPSSSPDEGDTCTLAPYKSLCLHCSDMMPKEMSKCIRDMPDQMRALYLCIVVGETHA